MIHIDLTDSESPTAYETSSPTNIETIINDRVFLSLNHSAARHLYRSLSQIFGDVTTETTREENTPEDVGQAATPYVPKFRDDNTTWIPLCPDHLQRNLRPQGDGVYICHERCCGRRFNHTEELERGTPLRCECTHVYNKPRRPLDDKCPDCGHSVALHQRDGCHVHKRSQEPARR